MLLRLEPITSRAESDRALPELIQSLYFGGYRQATVLQSTPLVQVGDRVWVHEFHRLSLVDPPDVPLLSLQGYDSRLQLPPEGWHGYGVHAAYTHVHFGAQPHLAQRFVEHCARTATAMLKK